MAKLNFDGIIEAVRYAQDGKIEVVRAFERRGATFSDNIIISRANLMTRLKNGQKFVTGVRKEYMGSTFETRKTVLISGDVITTGSQTNHDQLEEVPNL